MRGRFNRTICDTTTGIIVPFARVEVFEQVSGNKPDLFSVETGGLPISNPMTATSLGFAGFFLDPGQYRFVASTAGGTIVSEITHEVVVDPNANDGIFENIVAETFRGREIILEDISYGRVLVRDIADNTHYAEFKYEAPGNRATLSRTGYIHFDMSPSYVGVYDQVGAPILKGETTRTRLYRGGNEVFNVDTEALKIGFNSSLDIVYADISDEAVRIRNPNGTYPLSSAGGTLSLERPDGVDVLVSNSGVTNLASYNGGNLLTGTSSVTALHSPSGSGVLSATPTTTTINAGNGTQSIAISSSGGVVAQDYFGQKYSREHQWSWVHDGTIYSAVDIIIDSTYGWGELEINLSGDYSAANNNGAIYKVQQVGFSGPNDYRGGSHVREYNANGLIADRYHVSDLYYSATRSQWVVTVTAMYGFGDNPITIRAKLTLQTSQSNQALRGLTLSSTYTGTVKTAYPTGLSVPSLQADSATIGGNATAGNFYGNGYNITQINASNVVNGLLPSNIFPSTISTAATTFSGGLTVKAGTLYNAIEATGSNVTLRDYNGNITFYGSGTDTQLHRAGNILLNASATATQIFNHAGSIRANFSATNSQIFSAGGAPVLDATTTTTTISAGNGAPCLAIDSTGAGLMRFPVYTVGTVPSASANADRVIIVSNASLGRGLYTSDATNWRSAQSGTILS
jgi:hypothetical protein